MHMDVFVLKKFKKKKWDEKIETGYTQQVGGDVIERWEWKWGTSEEGGVPLLWAHLFAEL